MPRICVLLTAALIGISTLSTSAFAFEEVKGGSGKGKPRLTPEDRFKKMDANGDGKLSLDEFKAGKKNATMAETRFNTLDANKDGFVSLEELKAAPKPAKKKAS